MKLKERIDLINKPENNPQTFSEEEKADKLDQNTKNLIKSVIEENKNIILICPDSSCREDVINYIGNEIICSRTERINRIEKIKEEKENIILVNKVSNTELIQILELIISSNKQIIMPFDFKSVEEITGSLKLIVMLNKQNISEKQCEYLIGLAQISAMVFDKERKISTIIDICYEEGNLTAAKREYTIPPIEDKTEPKAVSEEDKPQTQPLNKLAKIKLNRKLLKEQEQK